MTKSNIGKYIMDVYPDAVPDITKTGALKTYIVPSEQMVVDATKEGIILRVYDPLKDDDEDDNPYFELLNLP